MFILPVVLLSITAVVRDFADGRRSTEFLNAGLLDDQHIVSSFEALSWERPVQPDSNEIDLCVRSSGPWTKLAQHLLEVTNVYSSPLTVLPDIRAYYDD